MDNNDSIDITLFKCEKCQDTGFFISSYDITSNWEIIENETICDECDYWTGL